MVEELLDEVEILKNDNSNSYDNLYKLFQELVGLFQEKNLDYQLVGDFAIMLKYGNEITTDISTIQINLNEKDMESFCEICKALNLKLQDNRLCSNKILENEEISGDEEVMVYYDDKPLLIIHCFERLVDGTIISKNYYQDGDDNPRAKEIIYGSKLVKEIFDKDYIEFFGYMVPIVSFEYLFIEKKIKYNLLNYLETKVDNRQISNIRNLMKTDKVTQFVLVNDLDITNTNLIEIDNNDISHILLEAQNNDLNETQNLEFLKEKLVHKDEGLNETGFSTTHIIIIIILIVLVLLLMGLIIFKLFD